MIRSIRMYITEKCNANCPSCFNKDVRGAAEMDLEHFSMLCSYFKLNNVKHIKIMGGEPTTHPDFNTFVKVAQDYFEYVHIFLGIPEQCRPVIPAQKGENDARSPIKNR